ncbi:cytoplasmic tRNA 2-thiolation protein 2 isoform X1 [Nerophis lumbriciformis]|uniref:cytoplasmic tRNA 2-thiolation protein 2 isoform X1 n=1 Tax=Nerophis lumbriciformis TaxID=546530 RepID=UPI002ADF5B91|nr:cytoplasmic tRNA 2-thiolation protein 2-like isoform X1 [Nerophis lumbriciformis]
MCQVTEEYHQDLEPELPSVSKKCVKCKEVLAVVVIRAGDKYCRDCFDQYFRHKFRAMLGKNRIIFPGEKVLLAVSGGPSSSSMLHQVQEGLSQSAHKRLRFLPGIIYVDEGGALGQSVEERRLTVAKMEDMFKATGFPFHILPLEQVLDITSSVVVLGPSSPQPASAYKAAVDHFIRNDVSSNVTSEKEVGTSQPFVLESQTHSLRQLMDSAKTLTAREDLMSMLRQRVLVHTARCEGYSKVMLGDSCTRLAVKLLSSISQGRGAHLAQDTGFSDCRYGDVISVRPMRDYSAKEIAYYNHLFHVPSVFTPNLHTKSKEKSSLQHLTESFVNKLQVDFPSTVSTIYRTSEKLQTACKNSSSVDHCERCLLCMCSLDTAFEAASAFQATILSDHLSQNKSVGANSCFPRQNPGSCCKDTGQCCATTFEDRSCSSGQRLADATDLKRWLCYSCQLTVKDMSSVDVLPQCILSEAQRRQRRSRMRDEISDFLLDD